MGPLAFTLLRRVSPASRCASAAGWSRRSPPATASSNASRTTFARLAVQHERARIARELHDIVAHHLAVMVVQAGAGRMAAASDDAARRRSASPASARPAARRLARWRRLLDLLEAERDTLPAPARARAARRRPATSATAAPDELGDTALRIVQEGLTNAVKHAPGADVDIDVRARPTS